jgi:hypothetical protein
MGEKKAQRSCNKRDRRISFALCIYLLLCAAIQDRQVDVFIAIRVLCVVPSLLLSSEQRIQKKAKKKKKIIF